MTTKMSLHRVLAELKTLDNRIYDANDDVIATCVLVNGKIKGSTKSVDTFKTDAKANYQSVNDLIDRRYQLKKALTKANAETIVRIAGKEMTIADAIDYKKVIEYKARLLAQLRSNFSSTNSTYNREIELVESKLEDTIKSATSKNEKPDPTLVTTLTESYRKSHPVEVIDPLNISKVIKELSDEVDTFRTEVDAVLSEANATTFVEV